MATRTKIEISPALVRGISGLDDLAKIFSPDNSNHRRAFLGLWLSIKYADEQFLAATENLTAKYNITPRTVEVVRVKMKKLGLIQRVSHFNPAFGDQSGWMFSPRFRQMLSSLGEVVRDATQPSDNPVQRQKDRDAIHYI
jgi:hypothetical protein